ncbi:MAG TPA: hypothetical protein ENO22_10835 [candidate division Zixibacteria bacterium]|nr:hypothetical protein [candidate division Zixibacteria bacterium]HEQ99822.1 hypothetical protein [candidate division Zixibacteria bacterium]
MADFRKIDLGKVKTYSIKKRASKVQLDLLGQPVSGGCCIDDFLKSLPKFLKAEDFKKVVDRMSEAVKRKFKIIFMLGAHNLKVGLTPLYVDFMDIHSNLHFAGNSAVSIHDLEIAFFGATSEDVLENLQDGSFGFVEETAELYSQMLKLAWREEIGLGHALGRYIADQNPPYKEYSLAYNCLRKNIPLTIHAAIGTDIVNQHPVFDGAAIGRASFEDFQIFADSVMQIANGGVALNIGSAVIMPEVFLKALAVCRNLNPEFGKYTTANFDMINHYRPLQNVVKRPAALNSEGYNITGHHELMIPLLFAAVKSYVE